jgi:hypothetical protein
LHFTGDAAGQRFRQADQFVHTAAGLHNLTVYLAPLLYFKLYVVVTVRQPPIYIAQLLGDLRQLRAQLAQLFGIHDNAWHKYPSTAYR